MKHESHTRVPSFSVKSILRVESMSAPHLPHFSSGPCSMVMFHIPQIGFTNRVIRVYAGGVVLVIRRNFIATRIHERNIAIAGITLLFSSSFQK